MQCKDIPDGPILERVWEINNADGWGHNFENVGTDRSIWPAFPANVPYKLLLAKMRKLIERGLLDGCPCGCRGDYIVTLKGCGYIDRPKHIRFYGDQCY